MEGLLSTGPNQSSLCFLARYGGGGGDNGKDGAILNRRFSWEDSLNCLLPLLKNVKIIAEKILHLGIYWEYI